MEYLRDKIYNFLKNGGDCDTTLPQYARMFGCHPTGAQHALRTLVKRNLIRKIDYTKNNGVPYCRYEVI